MAGSDSSWTVDVESVSVMQYSTATLSEEAGAAPIVDVPSAVGRQDASVFEGTELE